MQQFSEIKFILYHFSVELAKFVDAKTRVFIIEFKNLRSGQMFVRGEHSLYTNCVVFLVLICKSKLLV